MTIKRLTRGNPAMAAKFADLKDQNPAKPNGSSNRPEADNQGGELL
ncbi:hypothetical protein [Robbsia andropogonis]